LKEGTGGTPSGVETGAVTTMSSSSHPHRLDYDRSLWVLAAMIALSMAAHVATIVTLPEMMSRAPEKRVEMEFYEPPPPPPKVEEPPKEEPPKPVEKIKIKPIQVKVPEVVPPKDVPPPPNQEPPPEAPSKPVPIVVGISMSSTTTAGGFAVQVGNTTYGKASDKIVDPSQVKAYSAPKYAPPGSADTEPVPIGEDVKMPYPEEAKKADVEGPVLLNVTVDASGTVTSVSVIKGPGYGLNEAAREAIKKRRFKPAMKGGEPVTTSIVFTYTFLLD
jgi:protein TonB